MQQNIEVEATEKKEIQKTLECLKMAVSELEQVLNQLHSYLEPIMREQDLVKEGEPPSQPMCALAIELDNLFQRIWNMKSFVKDMERRIQL